MRTWFAAFSSAILLAACSGSGQYVWVQQLVPEAPPSPSEYLIATGDIVSIRVLNQDAMTTRTRVRADGRIAMPILGDIEVRGKRPAAVRAELEGRLKDYLVAPSITVNVDEFQPVQISVLGEVGRPGVVQVEPTAGVAQALAGAGGLTEYADRDAIYVIRRASKPLRVRFTYEAISRGEPAAARFLLHPGDTVVVE